jgi:hypothetical protein
MKNGNQDFVKLAFIKESLHIQKMKKRKWFDE